MQLRPLTLAAAAAFCLAGSVHATVVNFDDPGVITIDPITDVATYIESGYKIQGPATSFLPLDDPDNARNGFLVGGFLGDSVLFSLMAVSGGIFSLLSLDRAFFTFFPPGDTDDLLIISGLLDGAQVVSGDFSLGALTTINFSSDWSRLTQVTFQSPSLFSLDNINVAAVPEPGTLALVGLAAAGLAFTRRRTAVATPAMA